MSTTTIRCQGADCEPGNFEAVTSAYESVADAEARRIYDLNGYGVRSHGDGSGSGGRGGSGYRGHSGRRSRGSSGATFDDLFGGGWRNWNPGDHITYVHVRNGKSVKLEIFPDGTTVESEESALAMPSSSSYTGYSKTTMRSSSGHQSVHIQLDGLGSLEPLLVGAGVPSLVAAGLVGLLTLLCSPAGLFVCCVYCACGKNRNRDEVPIPGEHDQGGAQKNKNERVKAE